MAALGLYGWFRHTLKLFLATPPLPCSLAAFAIPASAAGAEAFVAWVVLIFGGRLQVTSSGCIHTVPPLRGEASTFRYWQLLAASDT